MSFTRAKGKWGQDLQDLQDLQDGNYPENPENPLILVSRRFNSINALMLSFESVTL